MRGRVLILLGLIMIGAVAVGAILLLGGNDGGTETTPTATPGDQGPGTDGQVIPTQPAGGPPQVESGQPVVIAVQDLPRGITITGAHLLASDAPGFGTAQSGQQLVAYDVWPTKPQNAVEAITDLIGCQVRTEIPRASPIVISQLVPDPRISAQASPEGIVCKAALGSTRSVARYGSDAALLLDSNTVGIAVPLDPTGLGQVAYAFQPGDRVDVIMSFLFIDVDEEFQTRRPNLITVITRLPDGTIGFTPGVPGREEPSNIFEEGIIVSPSEDQQRPRLVTQRTIQNALVIWPGWFPPTGAIYAQPTPTAVREEEVFGAQPTPVGGATAPVTATSYIPVIMTLGVTPQQALVLTWAIDSDIPITYTLRPAVQDATLNDLTEPVSLEYILREFEIADPPRLPVAVEPAVTDIRRFDLSSLRTFFELGFNQ
jgi:Flp pilus assembly protein CpaB